MGNLNHRTNDINDKDEKIPTTGRRAKTSTKIDEVVAKNPRLKSGTHRAESKTESLPLTKGRHKEIPAVTDPVNTEFLTKVHGQHRLPVPQTSNAAIITATTGGILLAAMTTGTSVASAPPVTTYTNTAMTKVISKDEVNSPQEIRAENNVKLTNARTSVVTSPAPLPPPVPVAAPVVKKVQAAPKPAAAAPVAPTKTLAQNPPAAPKPPVITAVGNKAAIIASAARAQLGRFQDCTRLASNALAAAGVKFHGWPAGYLGLGSRVSSGDAVPGDLIYYANGGIGVAHIAVYIGNGQAVHGGWNGNQTVVFSANVGSGPVFIRVA